MAGFVPDAAMGRSACEAASHAEGPQGSVGAGVGATVGKLFGQERAMKGGVGTASMELPGGGVVGAIAAVNAFGGIYDPETGGGGGGGGGGEIPSQGRGRCLLTKESWNTEEYSENPRKALRGILQYFREHDAGGRGDGCPTDENGNV